MAQAAADAAAIADALGVERFVTWGISGGGPHALACAALLPDRVAAAASLAGVMPLLAPRVNYFRGMGRDNLAEFGLAMAGRQHIDPWAQHAAARLRLATAAEHAEAFRTLLSDTDFATISGPPRPVAGGHDP